MVMLCAPARSSGNMESNRYAKLLALKFTSS
jgi:hypothetical protein